jgi:Domain of unknown function (DUF4296)
MKLFSSISFIIIIILFFSCTVKTKRNTVLSENKMREVVWDMLRADQYVSDFLLKDSTRKRKNESLKLYEEVFSIHKISEKEFKESLDYYSSRPDLFRPIIDSLAKRKTASSPYYHPPNFHPPGRSNNDSAAKLMHRQHPVKP